MMKGYKIYGTMLAQLICANMYMSCTSGSEADNAISLDNSVIAEIDSVKIDSIINPFAMRVVGDKLVMANNNANPIFSSYSIPDMDFVKSGIMTGHGPNELFYPYLASMTGYGDRQLSVQTSLPATIAIIDADNLSIQQQKKINLPENWQFYQTATFLTDGKVVMQNGMLPLDWIITDSEGREIASLGCSVSDKAEEEGIKDEIERIKVRTGFALAHPDGQRFAVCYRVIPHIDIYDSEGVLIKSLDIADAKTIDTSSSWIVCGDATDDSFFLNVHNPEDKDSSYSYIVEIGWNGEVKNTIKTPIFAGAFAVDAENDMIYFNSPNQESYIYSISI